MDRGEYPDASPDLLYLDDEADTVVIAWETLAETRPPDEIYLHAGNSLQHTTLPTFGPLVFAETDQRRWLARRSFDVADLGDSVFLAVLVAKDRSPDRILKWTAFRILTERERLAEIRPPELDSYNTLDISRHAIRIDTPRGAYPRSRLSGTTTWLSASRRGDGLSLDLDGDYTGAPDIIVSDASTWEHSSIVEAGILQSIRQRLGGALDLPRSVIAFDDKQSYVEIPPKDIPTEFTNGDRYQIHYFYTIITLRTAASVAAMGDGIHPVGFRHETSARVRDDGQVTSWASYSRGEYSADPYLLDLVEVAIDRKDNPDGLGYVSTSGGDGGGHTRYSVRMFGHVAPFVTPGAGERKLAGILSYDVVLARAGYETILKEGNDASEQIAVLCHLIKRFCDDVPANVDLNDPPRGYDVAAPYAAVLTDKGQVPLLTDEPTFAQTVEIQAENGQGERTIGSLPDAAAFELQADLRAGALMKLRKRLIGFLGVDDMIPVNAFAQFVVRATVVVSQDSLIVAAASREIPTPTAVLQIDPQLHWYERWWENISKWWASVSMIWKAVVVIAIVAVGGAILGVLRPVFSLLATLARLIVAAIKRLF